MPRSVDLAERDRIVTEAAWRVIVTEGMAALSVRRVAAEAGLPPSSLRYTFPTQAAVRERAIAASLDRLRDRVSAIPGPEQGRDWARAALLELLPLDPPRRIEMEVCVALGIASTTDPALQPLRAEMDAEVRALCARAAAAIGSRRPADADLLHGLVDGTALHLLTRPPEDDPTWATDAIDRCLDLLTAHS